MRINHSMNLTASRMRFGLGAQAKFMAEMADLAHRHRQAGLLLNLGDHSHKMPPKSLGDKVASWMA